MSLNVVLFLANNEDRVVGASSQQNSCTQRHHGDILIMSRKC